MKVFTSYLCNNLHLTSQEHHAAPCRSQKPRASAAAFVKIKKTWQRQVDFLPCNHKHKKLNALVFNSQTWRTAHISHGMKSTTKTILVFDIRCCWFNSLASLFLISGEHSIKWVIVLFQLLCVTTGVLVFISHHACMISIFHHVKQIEDNEGLRDEGQTCAQHTKRSICFQWHTKACCWRAPHWLCIRDWWSSSAVRLTLTPTVRSPLCKHWCVGGGCQRSLTSY